jgi:hypothetical protein
MQTILPAWKMNCTVFTNSSKWNLVHIMKSSMPRRQEWMMQDVNRYKRLYSRLYSTRIRWRSHVNTTSVCCTDGWAACTVRIAASTEVAPNTASITCLFFWELWPPLYQCTSTSRSCTPGQTTWTCLRTEVGVSWTELECMTFLINSVAWWGNDTSKVTQFKKHNHS